MQPLEKQEHFHPPPSHVLHCQSVEEMKGIAAPDCTLALHKAPLPFDLAPCLQQWKPGSFPSFRLRVRTTEDPLLTNALKRLHHPDFHEESQWLQRDILQWTEAFLQWNPASLVQVWLEEVNHDNCRSFHSDFVHLRLLRTYVGTGTQWLSNDEVRELRRGRTLCCVPDSLHPRTLSEGVVGLLKGDRYPGNEGNGIIHRSPPLQNGQSRLLLRLDAGFRQTSPEGSSRS